MKNNIVFSLTILILFALSNSLFAQTGSSCATPHLIPSLNFVQTGLSTSGNEINYDQNDACLSNSMTGNDYLFQYVLPRDEMFSVSLINTGNLVGLFLIYRCPYNPVSSCVANPTGTNLRAFEISNFNISYNAGNNASVTEHIKETIPYYGSILKQYASRLYSSSKSIDIRDLAKDACVIIITSEKRNQNAVSFT